MWNIHRLVAYEKNARLHTDQQVAQIVNSIKQFGWTNPLLVGSDEVVIAGHARLAAAKKLKMTEVPVIVLGHLNESQRRALVIADNQLALGATWDEDLLRLELAALKAADFDLDVVGFDEQELAELLAGEDGQPFGNTDEDEVPETPETPVSMPGDCWCLGDHRVVVGDATQMECIEKVMGGGLADMVFTDPPYGVNYGSSSSTRREREKRKVTNDNLGDEFGGFLHSSCMNLLAVTKGSVYICMSSSELHTLQKAFQDAGGHWSTFVIWAKDRFTLGRSDYHRQYEPLLYGWREGTEHFWCGARDQGDVWFVKKPLANVLHPTQKPVELVERAIRNSSKSRDTVLDPFGGSGTTLIACEKTGRQARLLELEPKYCDTTIERWQNFSGKEAVLDGDGRTFQGIARERLKAAA